MGARLGDVNAKGNFSLTYGNDATVVYSSTASSSTAVSLGDAVFGIKHNVKYQQSTKTLLFDNTNKWSSTWITNVDIPYNVYLFAFNSAGAIGGTRTGYVRIYSYSVKNTDGVLIQNFVPARNSDNELGFYDTVHLKFYTNDGSGSFTAGPDVIPQIKIATTRYNENQFAPVETQLDAAVAAVDTVVTQTMDQAQQIDDIANNKQTRPNEGCTAKYCLLVEDEDGTPHWYPIAGANGVAHNLPAGYTELQYIESTGTQYIDPDVSGNATFIGTAQSTTDSPTTSQVIVANGDASAGRWFGVQSPSVGEPFSKRWGLGATSRASTTIYGTTKIDFNITFSDVDGQYGTVNNETLTRTTSKPTQGDWIAFAGTESSQYGFIGKVWGLKIVQNDVLVRNLIPAKNSSNVVGMYDLVSGQFFTNAGTGTFTAGPDM